MSKVLIIGSTGIITAVSLFNIEQLEKALKLIDDSCIIVTSEVELQIQEEFNRDISIIDNDDDKFASFLNDYRYENIDIEEEEDYDYSSPILIIPKRISKKLEEWYPTGFT
jgi:hypothetical protein